MRCCNLALVLVGTTLHGAQSLDRRPALAIHPSSRPHDILRGGAGKGNKQPPPLGQARVKTIRRFITASNVISLLILTLSFVSIMRGYQASLMHQVGESNPLLQALEEIQCESLHPLRAVTGRHWPPGSYWISAHPSLIVGRQACINLVSSSNTLLGWPFNTVLQMPRTFGMWALLALAWSTVMVFDFVAKRLLRAWRPREFGQACVEMSQKPTPRPLLDLVLSIARLVLGGVFLSHALWYTFSALRRSLSAF